MSGAAKCGSPSAEVGAIVRPCLMLLRGCAITWRLGSERWTGCDHMVGRSTRRPPHLQCRSRVMRRMASACTSERGIVTCSLR
jgi:hypothetical protein